MSSRNNLRFPLLLLLFSTTISLARAQDQAFSRQQPDEAKSYYDLGADRYNSGRQSQ